MSQIFSLVFAAVILSFIADVAIIQGHSVDAAVVFPNFNFGAAGDWGCTPNATSTVKNMMEKGIELNLGLGDYSYKPSAKCWLDAIQPLFNKTRISIGNHDVENKTLVQQYMNTFNLTRQYYNFDIRNVHFLAISTELQNESDKLDQLNFVINDLDNASSNPAIDWIVVYFHRQAYTSPSLNEPDTIMRDTYHPLFDKYNVDLVLQAHNHNYQRSYPLKYNQEDPTSPIKVSNETNNYYSDLPGPIFVTVGTGGINLYPLLGKAPHIVNQANSSYGFLNVDVINNGTKLSAKFLSNNGTVGDQFTIVKSQ
jgi:hypothetical protein